jgi:hypothetical protein
MSGRNRGRKLQHMEQNPIWGERWTLTDQSRGPSNGQEGELRLSDGRYLCSPLSPFPRSALPLNNPSTSKCIASSSFEDYIQPDGFLQLDDTAPLTGGSGPQIAGPSTSGDRLNCCHPQQSPENAVLRGVQYSSKKIRGSRHLGISPPDPHTGPQHDPIVFPTFSAIESSPLDLMETREIPEENPPGDGENRAGPRVPLSNPMDQYTPFFGTTLGFPDPYEPGLMHSSPLHLYNPAQLFESDTKLHNFSPGFMASAHTPQSYLPHPRGKLSAQTYNMTPQASLTNALDLMLGGGSDLTYMDPAFISESHNSPLFDTFPFLESSPGQHASEEIQYPTPDAALGSYASTRERYLSYPPAPSGHQRQGGLRRVSTPSRRYDRSRNRNIGPPFTSPGIGVGMNLAPPQTPSYPYTSISPSHTPSTSSTSHTQFLSPNYPEAQFPTLY